MGKLINANQAEFKQILDTEENVILVDFWAEWCGPCRMLGPILQDISEDMENVTVVKVNVDENPELSAEFKVRNIPVVFAIKNGEEVDKVVGLAGKDRYINIINQYSGETEETESDESED